MTSRYVDINEKDFAQLKQDNKDIKVIDVRTPGEFAYGHIPGAMLRPLGEISSWVDEFDPNEALILVCASGSRSVMAAVGLNQRGFSNLYNLRGGMGRWNGPVQRG
ncbi:MAG TPA: rhodanese-like domain-containing protein [Verrucomicrobiae bacterium]|nr:rhodanese-like domain-containing protein [Verrucomicrobiae bacterium]